MTTNEETTTPVAGVPHGMQTGGVLVVTKGKKKKKRRYTKLLKPSQKLERGISRVNRRLAKAVVSGIETWQKRRDKSARKRRDGALRDWVPNSIRAYGKMVRVASRASNDFLKEVSPRLKSWRILRSFPSPMWFWLR